MIESTCGTNVKKSMRFNGGTFHPYELAFCGYSGSGKTTLIKNLVAKFSAKYSIAYIKHDAHHFSMDHEGKDTFVIKNAGAQQVYINNNESEALLSSDPKNKYFQPYYFQDCDWAFIEGYKNLKIPKILVLDQEGKVLDDYKQGKITDVIAVVGFSSEALQLEKVSYFQRDQIDGIGDFIEDYFHQRVLEIPLNGLVLTGGKSSRMGQDKSQMNYHGKAQYEYIFEMLDGFCDESFISVAEKSTSISQPQLSDEFNNFGPMGGILTAMKYNSNAAWVVVACDMPFLNERTIKYLIDQRNPYKVATSYKSLDNDFPEPLCSIFEPKSIRYLYHFLGLGFQCPRKILINSPIHLLIQPEKGDLDNVNTPEEYEQAKEKLNQEIK